MAVNCESLMQHVKANNLHFQVLENPFNLQISIHKKFIDDTIPSSDANESLEAKIKLLEGELKKKS